MPENFARTSLQGKEGEISIEVDDRDAWWRKTMGLPSPWRIMIYILEGFPMVPDEIDIFWKQIRWAGVKVKDLPADDGDRLTAESVSLNEFLNDYRRGHVDSDDMYKIAEKWRECKDPKTCHLQEPPKGKTNKGRPKGS